MEFQSGVFALIFSEIATNKASKHNLHQFPMYYTATGKGVEWALNRSSRSRTMNDASIDSTNSKEIP